jgi:hypothetical protein
VLQFCGAAVDTETEGLGLQGLLPKSPGANIKEFLVTILGEAKEEQFPLFEPTGRVWKLPEASLRMVKKSFQRAKGDLSNSPLHYDILTFAFLFALTQVAPQHDGSLDIQQSPFMRNHNGNKLYVTPRVTFTLIQPYRMYQKKTCPGTVALT